MFHQTGILGILNFEISYQIVDKVLFHTDYYNKT